MRRFTIGLVMLLCVGVLSVSSARADEASKALALKQLIPELYKGHHDKLKLAWYVTTFRTVDPAIKAFVEHMRDGEQVQTDALEAWAKGRGIDPKFHYGDTPIDKARKMMEDASGDALQAAKGDAFGLMVLMDMNQDYNYQIAVAKSLLQNGPDEQLKTYLKSSIKMHEAGLAEIEGLMKRYKFQ